MCGIVGAAGRTKRSPSESTRRMFPGIAHRGPDGHGFWEAPDARVSFGHARLAIIDLSPTGSQPMASSSGRYTITFNGEIYNYIELREELEKTGSPSFRGTSDTEVLLAAFDQWGVPETLPRLNGMFAFGVWDNNLREILLARDRFGEKPLYYSYRDGELLFASELKAFQKLQGTSRPALDPDSVSLFLRYNYVPAPRSIFQGVQKLPAACLLTVREPFTSPVRISRYWAIPKHREKGLGNTNPQDFQERRMHLRDLFADAVRIRMRSDVPFGAFLSGGIDSSLVCALMKSGTSHAIETFTIGSTDVDLDESLFARAVADHFGTRHHETIVTSDDALRVIPDLPGVYDEPFADASQIPTLLVARWARKHVKVCLTGDGGDEIFGGYRRYNLGRDIWTSATRVPAPLRRPLASLLHAVPTGTATRILHPFYSRLSLFGTHGTFADKAGKIAEVLQMNDHFDLYCRLTTFCQDSSLLVESRPMRNLVHPLLEGSNAGSDLVTDMMEWDAGSYLPDDILTKVDRASMSTGLETRAPFLDHRLAEAVQNFPTSDFLADGVGKPLLRSLLADYLPKQLIDRPKRGFSLPISNWMRGPLKNWAEELLDVSSLAHAGVFKATSVTKLWNEHLDGRRNHGDTLWSILSFTSWFRGQTANSL